jgi:prepilin-type N-terminal cleavage/methylation domain-containing protein
MASTRQRSNQHGLTLIELVIAIVIISISVIGVLGVLTRNSTSSAATLVRAQAMAIGSAYLAEALLKPFADPNASDGETLRTAFDDVDDYHNLDNNGARDQGDNLLSGLGAYRVRMTVVNGTLGSLPASDVKRVDVRVTHAVGVDMLFSGYRTRDP